MKYIILIILSFFFTSCVTKEEEQDRIRWKRSHQLAARIYSSISNTQPVHRGYSYEFQKVPERIFNNEDTIFDVATKDFRVLIFIKRKSISDTSRIDTVLIDQTNDNTTIWEDEDW